MIPLFISKPECTDDGEPCSKIYIDKYTPDEKNIVIGYNFLCTCPAGMKCPDKNIDGGDIDDEVKTDFRGTYIPRYCEVVHKGARK